LGLRYLAMRLPMGLPFLGAWALLFGSGPKRLPYALLGNECVPPKLIEFARAALAPRLPEEHSRM